MSSLVRVADTRLSAMTTAEDIGRILLAEITGDETMGKAALFQLAGMAAETSGFSYAESGPDIIEYLLITGSAAAKTSPADIAEYLRMKASCRKDVTRAQNPRFRELLRNVALRGREEVSLLEATAHDFSRLYRDFISGAGAMPQGSPAGGIADSYLAPEIVSAGRALLTNFPILGRLELAGYSDIIAGIEIDSLLPLIPVQYSRQIRETLEARIDEIARGIAAGEATVKAKYNASEMLLQAKTAYLIARGIELLAPRISAKHMDPRSYEDALISAVSRLRQDREDAEDRQREEDMRYDMYFWNYNSFEAERSMNEQIRRRMRDRKAYAKDSGEVISNIEDAIREAGGLPLAARLLLKKSLIYLSDAAKRETGSWDRIFSMLGAAGADIPGLVILAYAAGMKAHMSYVKEGESEPAGIGITSYALPGGAPQMVVRRKDVYLDEGEMYLPLDDPARAIHALLATYVNNNIISALPDPDGYPASHAVEWRNPCVIGCSYSPEDIAVARYLMENYPVFSRIPVMGPEDVVNGIVLNTVQALSGDSGVDEGATITQNLFLRHMYCLNRFMGDGR